MVLDDVLSDHKQCVSDRNLKNLQLKDTNKLDVELLVREKKGK